METWQKIVAVLVAAAVAFLGFSFLNQPHVWGATGEGGGVLLSCQDVTLSGAYTLTAPINTSSGACLNVLAENVSIDCQGNSITGGNDDGSYGIYSSQFNTTVKNCNVSNFTSAIKTANCAVNGIIIFGATGQAVLNSAGRDIIFDGLNISLIGYSLSGTGACNILWTNSTIKKSG